MHCHRNYVLCTVTVFFRASTTLLRHRAADTAEARCPYPFGQGEADSLTLTHFALRETVNFFHAGNNDENRIRFVSRTVYSGVGI